MDSASWKGFVEGLPADSRLRKVLLETWRHEEGDKAAQAEKLSVRSVSPDELDHRLGANADLLRVAIPHLSWMAAALANIPHVVFLIDQDGIVLHSSGNDTKRMADFALFPGYDWSEDAMGPNGGGSALAHNRPVAILGPEHISSPLDDCTCTGAPLYSPDGAVIGAIAVNTGVADGTPERLVLVAHTAYVINQELLHQRERRADKYQLLQHTTIRILAETHSLSEAAPRILEIVANTLQLKWGAVWRIDPHRNVLRCAEIWHDPQPWFSTFDEVSRGIELTHGEGLPGRAWAIAGPTWSTKLVNELHPERAAAAVTAGFTGGFAIPVRNGIVMLGILEFFDGASINPDPEFFRAMDTIGSQLGLFIQRRQAESALRDSQLQYSTLAETVPGILFSATADGSADYNSPQLYDYTGMSSGSADGAGWLGAVQPDDRQMVRERWQKAVETGENFTSEHRLQGKDGSYRWFVARAAPARDAEGNVIRWFGNAIDIDQQKRAEEALRQADQRKDEFLGMLAHELRNPLAPIRNALQVLAMQPNDPETVKSVHELAEHQFEHMSRLIDDLLDVSRISRGKIKLKMERVDFGELVQRIAESLRLGIEEQGQELSVSISSQSLLVSGDQTRLEQVVANLVNNASKFTDSGGRIRVMVDKDRNQILLKVEDNGKGIDPALLPHVFEVFVQGDNSLDRGKGGLGIGLTLVKRLVEMHGGSVSAHSDGVDDGSRFTVRLPLQLQKEGHSSSPGENTVVATRPLRVLVVDDNTDSTKSLEMMIRQWGHQVQAANDGATALASAKTFEPDVVLLDIGLPGQDGYTVAKELRNLPCGQTMFIAALTGYGSLDDQERSREAGFDQHLVKPLAPATLSKLLANQAATD